MATATRLPFAARDVQDQFAPVEMPEAACGAARRTIKNGKDLTSRTCGA
jgi:hypothetical protein